MHSITEGYQAKGKKMQISRKMKKILIILTLALILSIQITSLVVSYVSGVRGIGLLGICLFFTAAVIIVLAQVIPATILLVSAVKSVISSIRGKEKHAHA